MKPQISILGCGWLGLPLAKALIINNFLVKGSTTTADKLLVLETAGIQPFLVILKVNRNFNDSTKSNIGFERFLADSKILLINIPPKLRGTEKENFVQKIKNVLPFIEKSNIEEVIFISSTSVYGRDNLIVDEETILNPDTESGIQLVQTEQLLLDNSNFKTTIVRFGGLIGEDRNPVRFLAGKTNIENPNLPINLIHQDDCVGIILAIIEKSINNSDSPNDIFNAVTSFHPSRKDYYTKKAIDLKLPMPQFTSKIGIENENSGRTILSHKIKNVLGYNFKKPNL